MFAVIWFGLLIAPVLAPLTLVALRKSLSRAGFRVVSGGLVLALLLLCGIGLAGISFTGPVFNGGAFVAGYSAYCLLASACWLIPSIVVRILALFIAAIPIVFGYIMSTIGVLALMFIVGDYTRPPESVQQMAPGLTCRVTGWGAAGASSGYAVNLYRTWSAVPFLERRVHGHSVIQVGYSGTEPADDVSCSSIWAEYSK